MADAALGVATEALLRTVLSLAAEEITLAWGLDKELTKLARKVEMVQALLSDAQSKQVNNKAVQRWLELLQSVALDAQIVLDDFGYEVLRQKIENRKRVKVSRFFSSSNPVSFRSELAHKVKDVMSSLEQVYVESGKIGLRPVELINSLPDLKEKRLTDPFVEDSEIVGRDDDTSQVINMLTDSDYHEKDLPVITILGMGGQGKTTLTQLVYKDAKVESHFDKRVWVCVSENFNVQRLLAEMLQSLTGDNSPPTNTEALVSELKVGLSGKRYLLVLDDVWNKNSDEWDRMRSCLLQIDDSKGSKVLVTTRSEDVASAMRTSGYLRLQVLSPEHSWELFEKRAFAEGGATKKPELVDIGKRILERCGGIPLAIKAIGGLLNSKHSESEWLMIEKSGVWSDFSDEGNRVLSVIRLCYDHLPSFSLKQCFAYCAIFEKDTWMRKDMLIQLWMAQGLLNPPKGSDLQMEDVGSEYFNILLRMSFLQNAERDDLNNITCCKMHDLVHDFSLQVSENYCFHVKDWKQVRNMIEAVHLSITAGEGEMWKMLKGIIPSKLRTLHLKGHNMLEEDLSANFRCLSVLIVEDEDAEELPYWIGKMKHLRFLDISHTKIRRLPMSLTELYYLQTLRVCNLAEVHVDFRKLINLRHICLLHAMPISMRDSDAGGMSLSERVQDQHEATQSSEILPISLTDASSRERNAGGMSLSESIKEQHEATRYLETEIASMLATPSEMEGNSPLEPSVSKGEELSPSSMLPLLSEVEPDQTPGEWNMSLDSNLLIEVSVEGELSNYMDLKFETSHGFWSSKGKSAMNEFKYCDFASEADNYRILKREKTMKMEVEQSKALEGDNSSSEVPESSENPSIKLPEHLIFKLKNAMLPSPPEEEKWRQTGVMVLRDSAFASLPQKPDCPNLVLLFLQRNRCLREIPESFFSCMHSLRVVDLSDDRMSSLPSSLFRLDKLQVLILRNCKFLDELPNGIRELKHLEVLDLSGTELSEVPDGIGHLTHMRKLHLTFYGTDDESEYIRLPQDFLSHGILSKLQSLEALSIVVHPEDVRWIRNAETIMQDVGNLNRLSYLEFYFPRVEILKKFIEMSPSWPKISFDKFKFVVGQNVKRFADRVPNDVENKFNKQKRCLRFVNGEDAPQAVKEVLKRVTAFYLDHHLVIQSLSEFGITTSKEIKFCIVRECPNVEVIIRDVGNVEPAYPSLEHMGMHYLWKLKSISIKQLPKGSFGSLKSLVVHICPGLEFVLYESMLQFLHNLEELVVEDCESVTEIIREIDGEVNDCISALPPKLSKIKLYYLPQLLTLWGKLEANLEDPELNAVRVVTVYSCPKLDFSLLESIATDVIVLDSETVFQHSEEQS